MMDNDSVRYHDLLPKLLKQEKHYRLPANYFDLPDKHRSSLGISKTHREKMCVWAFQIIDHFSYDRETASISANLSDRYLSHRFLLRKESGKSERTLRNEFQLVAMTALYIAVKVHEPHYSTQYPFSLKSVARLSQDHFSATDIFNKEREMLEVLDWRMHPPTALTFLRCYIQFIEDDDVDKCIVNDAIEFIIELSSFLSELAVCDVDTFCLKLPSILALAALYCAIDRLDLEYFPLLCRQRLMHEVHARYGINSWSQEVFSTQEQLLSLLIKTKSSQKYNRFLAEGVPMLLMKNVSNVMARDIYSCDQNSFRVSFSEESDSAVLHDQDVNMTDRSRPRTITEESSHDVQNASMDYTASSSEVNTSKQVSNEGYTYRRTTSSTTTIDIDHHKSYGHIFSPSAHSSLTLSP